MPPSIPGPAYRIVTARLVIRCYNPADAPLLKEAIDGSLDHLAPWMPWAVNRPDDLQNEINLLRSFRASFDLGQDFVYGIFSLDETRCLGGTGLHTRLGPGAREIGYWIRKDSINQGLATEVAAALTRVAFEIDAVERVEIHCDPENVRSFAVARKLGYTHDATLRQRLLRPGGTARDTMVWSLLKSEYPSSPAASAKIEAYDAAGRCLWPST
jgi:RimJ/RimL family protein N-acetyltransferase